MSETHLQQQQQTPHHHFSSHQHLSSTQRTRSTSSISAAESKVNNGDGGGDHTFRQHKPKQFVVSRHGHNPRVPSFGRGLNKLAKPHATSPKREGPGRSSKKGGATFELGSPTGSTTDGGSYQDEPQPPPIARTGSNNRINRADSNNGNLPRNSSSTGLQKSSSTRSLDHESRKHRATRRGTTTDKADRARSKSGDRKRQQQGQQQTEQAAALHLEQQRHAQSSDKLKDMMTRAAAAPPPHPQAPPTQRPPSPTDIVTPPTFHSPVTPAHSLPNSQEPLTSRFIHNSPSSGADSTPNKRLPPLSRSESAYSIASSAAPSRTQQKLWLQRAAVDAELPHVPPAIAPLHPHHGRDWYVIQTARAEKEYDRVGREYLNVRRFKNPLGEAIERVRELQALRGVAVKQQRPATGDAGVPGSTQLLSRSLQEGDGSRRGAAAGRNGNGDVMRHGSRDDLAVDGRGGGEVEAQLERMWRREVLVSTNNE